ncbi:MAG: hypothetical protein HQ546_02750, partial [Planctomycetes bacterium]|nr:hypothetical protein [Planctomycetota bacterium]
LKERMVSTSGDDADAAIGQKLNAAYAAKQYGAPQPRYIDRQDQEGH